MSRGKPPFWEVDELADYARAAGLGRVADQLARSALPALALSPQEGGGSFLGGPPALPAGLVWPEHEGEPQTCFACLALDELPDVPGRERLPRSGWILFFVDLLWPLPILERQHLPLAGGAAAILVAPPGPLSVPLTPGGRRLPPTEVGARVRPSLPHPELAPGWFDLTKAEARLYTDLWYVQHGRAVDDPPADFVWPAQAQVFGHSASLLYEDPAMPWPTLLLSMVLGASPQLVPPRGVHIRDGEFQFILAADAAGPQPWLHATIEMPPP